MPNIVAHCYITHKAKPDRPIDTVLGSTLPDFEGMHKDRTGRKWLKPTKGINLAVDDGYDFNSTTDAVYDSMAQYPQATQPLWEDLQAAGLPYRAARETSRFAVDVLLDRALLDYEQALEAYRVLKIRLATGKTALATGEFDPALTADVLAYFKNDVPQNYMDPRSIALMARHRLAARSADPARRIAPEQINATADVLRLHADRVGELGLVALRQTVSNFQGNRRHR